MKFKKSLSAIIIFMLIAIMSIPVSAKTKVTYSNFLKVKMGSTYSQVVKIVGSGKKESSSSIGGIKSVVYSWTSGMGTMTITTENGKVLSKAQLGLTNVYAKITNSKYKKLKDGMSYKKVKSIMGKGSQLVAESKMSGIDVKEYSWINSSGSNADCTFTNGKLDGKYELGL